MMQQLGLRTFKIKASPNTEVTKYNLQRFYIALFVDYKALGDTLR